MKKILLVIITIILAFIKTNAQQNTATESKEVAFRIYYTYNTHDTILALIDGGSNNGIEMNMIGRCRSVYRKDAGTEGFSELGFIKIVYLKKDTCAAIITLNNINTSKDSVHEGDLISVNINLPKKDYHSLYFDLALLNIQFQDLYKKKFVTPSFIYKNDGKHFEDSLNKLVLADIKEVYTSLKDYFKPTDDINKPLDSGRYKGKTTMEVMRDATATDVKHFLQFVKSYPGKYIGFTWKSSETFATWVLNKGLTSSLEIKDELTNLRNNKIAFTKYAIENRTAIIKEGTSNTLSDESITLIANAEYAKAKDNIDFGFDIANAINDTSGKATLFVCRAEWYQFQEKYTEAIPFCNEAIRLAALAKNYSIELQSYFKKVYCLYRLSKYSEARNTIAAAEARLEEIKSKIDNETYRFNLRKRYDYAGWVDYESGSYNDAITNFKKAVVITKMVNNYQSKNDLATSYEYLGLTYNNQGNYKNALPYFDSAITILKSFNKIKLAAIITNRKAASYFKLGEYKTSIEIYEKTSYILLKEKDYNNVSLVKSKLGQAFWSLGKHADAIASHQEAIQYGKLANNNARQAYSWESIGDLYKLTGEKTKALAAYDSCANYYAIIKDSSSIINNFNNVGNVYKNDKNFPKAIEYYQKALNYAQGLSAKTQQIDALYNIASANFTYDSATSKKYYKLCIDLSKTVGDLVNEFYASINLAVLESSNKNLLLSKKYFEQAKAITNKTNSPDDIALLYNRMGSSALNQLEFEEAEDDFLKSMKIYDSLGNKTELIKCLSILGSLNISKGKFDIAEKYYANSITLADSISNKLLKGDGLNALAYLYELQGDFKKGFDANDSAMAIYKSTGSTVSLADAYVNRGILYSSVSQFAKSADAYETADNIYTTEKMETARATTINNIANVYYLQADYEKALTIFKKAELKLTPGIKDETYLLVEANIAECEYYLKNYDKAEQKLLELLPQAQSKKINRITGGIAIVLGKLYYGKKQYADAEKYLNIAKDISFKSGEVEKMVESSVYAGKVFIEKNNKPEAYNNLLTAVYISKKYNLTKFNWETQYELGLYHYQNNASDSAIYYFKNAVELVEKSTANLFGGDEAKKKYSSDEKKVDLYSKLVATLAAANKSEEAWFYANKSSNAALKDKLGTVSVNENDKTKVAAVTKATVLMQQQTAIEKSITDLKAKPDNQQSAAQIASLNKKREIISSEYLNYIQQLVETYPELSEYFKKNANPEEFKKYKSKLPADVAALLYLINDNQLLIFTVTNEKIGIRVVEMKEDINTTITQYIGLLNVPGKSSGTGTLSLRSTVLRERKPITGITFTETSEKLYNLLIKDILPDIKDKKKLCIIPNGRLTNIPFQCLGQRMADSSFHFLVEDYSVFYTSKLDIFLDNTSTPKNFASFTAFGNPDKSLPSSKDEVNAIGKIMLQATILTEDAASEEKAKNSLTHNKYVHFATHGILDYTDFKNSYLKFSANTSGGEDGKLTIEEVKTLDITDCELVTLSACETAISQELKKGWYVSPANSFLINNVKSVVASLWSVDDNATSILMKEFYNNLQTMGKADALRKAQATLSKDPKYVHPFYWGAFVLYGDWK